MSVQQEKLVDFEIPLDKLNKTSGFLTIELDFGKTQGYVNIEKGIVTRFVEKEHISDYASNGTFILSNGKALFKAIEKQIKDKAVSCNGEYCIGPAFNYLIRNGFQIYPVLTKARYDLGNISDINRFAKSPITQIVSKDFDRQKSFENRLPFSYSPLTFPSL